MKFVRSLQNEIVISFILLAMFPSLIGGGVTLIYFQNMMEKEAQQNLQHVTALWDLATDQWYQNAAKDIRQLANTPNLWQAEEFAQRSLFEPDHYAGIWQLNSEGQLLQTIKSGELPEETRWETLKEFNQAELGPLQLLKSGTIVLPIRVDVANEELIGRDQTNSYLLALLSSQLMMELFTGKNQDGQSRGFFADSKGNVLSFIPDRSLSDETWQLIGNCREEVTGSGIVVNDFGDDVVTAYRWLGYPNACLIVEVDREIAIGKLGVRLPLLVALILGIIIGISLLGVRFLSRHLMQPINELVGIVNKVADGDFTSRPKESQLVEIKKLHRAFTDMANSLETYNRYLEERVSQRTLELNEKNLQLRETMRLLDEEKKKQVQQAYNAGIVEHAISVLHNIGNAITPLAVRLQKLHQNKVESQFSSYLQQLCSLLEQHQSDLGDFFSSSRGQQFLPFLKQLTQTADQQKEDELKSMDVMAHQLDHITEIIALQQKYATQQSNTEEIQISQVIDDAMEMMKPAFDKRNIIVLEDVQPELPRIQNDPNKLVQIFMNLFKNSIESIDQCLRAPKEGYQGRVRVGVGTVGVDQLHIYVKDNGQGAEPESLKRAFEFGYSTKKRGSGFGLHDCANFIRFHKGTVELTSEGIGKGATITFTLPITKSKNEKDEQGA
ncbi:MAG: hypothetical protein CL913_00840 [Deltaproteobacteria bacterium]|nr:hypothetical protein [Deltaproteobacteria bacterium]